MHIFGGGGLNGAIADVGRPPETVMATYTPEVVMIQKRHEILARFQRILDIFGYSPHPTRWSYLQHCPMPTDIRATTRNSNGGEQTGCLAVIAISGRLPT